MQSQNKAELQYQGEVLYGVWLNGQRLQDNEFEECKAGEEEQWKPGATGKLLVVYDIGEDGLEWPTKVLNADRKEIEFEDFEYEEPETEKERVAQKPFIESAPQAPDEAEQQWAEWEDKQIGQALSYLGHYRSGEDEAYRLRVVGQYYLNLAGYHSSLDYDHTGYVALRDLEKVLGEELKLRSEAQQIIQLAEISDKKISIEGFLCQCRDLWSSETVLGKLLIRLRSRQTSLMQHVQAWVALAPSSPSVIALHCQQQHNCPSSAVYPRADSHGLPLAALLLDGDGVVGNIMPARSVVLRLSGAGGLSEPHSSFWVQGRHAKVCLFNPRSRSFCGASTTVPATLDQTANGRWKFLPFARPGYPRTSKSAKDGAEVIVKLPSAPPSMAHTNKKTSAPEDADLLLRVELTATVRRLRVPDSRIMNDPGRFKDVIWPPRLEMVIKQPGRMLGSTTRYLTWEWGKGLTVFEKGNESSAVLEFSPCDDIAEVVKSERKFGFTIRTKKSRQEMEYSCESEEALNRLLNTVRDDLKELTAEESQAAHCRTYETFEVCLGWVELPLPDPLAVPLKPSAKPVPLSAAIYIGSAGSSAVGLPPAEGAAGSSFCCAAGGRNTRLLSYTMSNNIPGELLPWVHKAPIMACMPTPAIYFTVLFRQMLAEKLQEDAGGMHWSLLEASNDPVLRWLPAMLDDVEAFHTLCEVWAHSGISAAECQDLSRRGLDTLLLTFGDAVRKLYPSVAISMSQHVRNGEVLRKKSNMLDQITADASRPTRNFWAEFKDLPATAVDDMPFHTSEIISDVMDDLLPLQERIWPEHLVSVILETRLGLKSLIYWSVYLAYSSNEIVPRLMYLSQLVSLTLHYRENLCTT